MLALIYHTWILWDIYIYIYVCVCVCPPSTVHPRVEYALVYGVPIFMGDPQKRWMVYFMEHPIKMDDLGVFLFQETSITWFWFCGFWCNPWRCMLNCIPLDILSMIMQILHDL